MPIKTNQYKYENILVAKNAKYSNKTLTISSGNAKYSNSTTQTTNIQCEKMRSSTTTATATAKDPHLKQNNVNKQVKKHK
jgi:hypothetical protein